MHAFLSLIGKIFSDIKVGVLGRFDQIGIHFESEGSEIAVVDSTAVDDLFPDVFTESLDDEMELGLGIEGFDGLVGPGLSGLMLSGVVLCVTDDPTWDGRYQV